ncbi:tRNA epoxyqueuosine(34) reductase QueG [Stieleria varia]|uniref:Epoxyqueuosine reductase n=1 Tax=Stieleria varia TaxID=2528005 RepID=A0A5C6B0M6_9BACT|nr:tRNA epoxyqueuosine(34) reductase QueG [Stieleria varia]TWU04846.1 Epoxyqueuosine reductase [Stieleria varia]
MDELNSEIRSLATQLGFIATGFAPAVQSTGFHHLTQWIESGYAAGMQYFADRLDAYHHPDGVLTGTKSIIALAFPYPPDAGTPPETPRQAKVARYSWPGLDYHDVIHPKLKQICRLIVDRVPQSMARGVVDTAPLMEREVAQLAGLGWRGKNTLLLNKQLGSYFFLACVLTDVELPTDSPHQSSHCGTCTACLDACPTDAFPQPGVLDASRCISYLTIEHRGSIPMELRSGIGDWLFGCDVCQEVCPWNRKPSRVSTDRNAIPLSLIDPHELLTMNEETFRHRFRKTPFWRTRRRGMMRNAAIVLGNQGDAASLSALRTAADEPDEIVQEACQWAIEQIVANQFP